MRHLQVKSKYMDISKYTATPVYIYATKQKEHITSGYTSIDSNNGNPRTKYDSKSTSTISSLTWTKPAATTYTNGSGSIPPGSLCWISQNMRPFQSLCKLRKLM